MSDLPVTRPMDDPMECDCDVPPVPGMRQSGTGHSARQITDNSKNKKIHWNDWGPWMALFGLLVGIALTVSITDSRRRDDDKASIQAQLLAAHMLIAASNTRISDLQSQLTAAEGRLTEAARKMSVDCTLLRNHVDVLQGQVDVQTTLTKSAIRCDNWEEVIYGSKRR